MEINLSGDVARIVAALAEKEGLSTKEVLLQAIALRQRVFDVQNEGGKILIQIPDKEIRELFFR